MDGDEIEKQRHRSSGTAEAAEKAGFEHFMIKEIHEQPKAVHDTINSVVKDGAIDLSDVGLTEEQIKKYQPDLYCCMWLCLSCWSSMSVCL